MLSTCSQHMQCLALRLETSGLSERLERGGQGGGGGLWRLEMFESDGHFSVWWLCSREMKIHLTYKAPNYLVKPSMVSIPNHLL